MNRKLLKQIRNEWKSNLWLMAELLIVSVVMWYIVDYVWVKTAVYTEPLGFDAENVFKISVESLNENSPEFDKERGWRHYTEDHQTIDERMKHYPAVEYSARGLHANPYSPSNRGQQVKYDSISSFEITRSVQPEMMMVYRIKGNAGETSEQLAEKLRRGELLMSENAFANVGHPDASFVRGKDVILDMDSSRTWKVGALYVPVKYSEFQQWMNNSIYSPFEDWMYGYSADIHVRVKPGQEKDFVENLRKDADKLFRVGNQYISDIQPLSYLRKKYIQQEVNDLRDMFIGMGFLMLNIFLGLLGTFWFRTQMRTRDIALRKVCGATRGDVFKRLIGEGLLLLALVTPVAIGIDWLLAHFELNQWYKGGYLAWGRMLGCAGITFGLMAAMIVAGIAIPARRAMRIEPAEALRTE